jgi:hypothetical protein
VKSAENGDVRSNQCAGADRYQAGIYYRAIEVYENTIPYAEVCSVVNLDRCGNPRLWFKEFLILRFCCCNWRQWFLITNDPAID